MDGLFEGFLLGFLDGFLLGVLDSLLLGLTEGFVVLSRGALMITGGDNSWEGETGEGLG